jgi:hypothetical protein
MINIYCEDAKLAKRNELKILCSLPAPELLCWLGCLCGENSFWKVP